MKVKFTKSYTTKTTPPETFEEGQVVDFAELRGDAKAGKASAQHFINKGVAEEVKPAHAHALVPPSPKKPDAK